MREFFHGWRRKLGCVVLLMACVIFMMWMRSLVIEDQIEIKPPDEWHRLVHHIESSHSVISWTAWSTALGQNRWRSVTAGPHRETILNEEWPQYQQGLGMRRIIQREVPYWVLVLPLTFLSAWLILGRQRQCAQGNSVSSLISPEIGRGSMCQ